MKNFNLKDLLPHLMAVGIFLLVALIFCKPALETGVILQQHDTSSWRAMSQQSFEYKEKFGHFPLWSVSMFSGMPAFQIAIEGDWSPLYYLDRVIQLGLPQPFNFFFLACISFYFLCIVLRIRPWIAIFAGLAFAYCSYSPIIITAGHVTKMLALGYAPFLIGACILIFQKKYLMGFTLATLFATFQIAQGHQQISYYLLFILAILCISFGIRLIREKQTQHFFKSIGLMLIAGMLGVAAQAISLFPTYDYAKESKRGSQLVMENDARAESNKVEDGKTVGMSKEYAFQWSYGIGETLSLMFPGVSGYGFHYSTRDEDVSMYPKLDENAHVLKYISEKLNLPQNNIDQLAAQFSQSLYWGKQPFTNGPVYLGAAVCFLFILGMYLLDNKHKWWIFAASVLGIILAWGHNFPAFNNFMFDYFPVYNKFRVPTMALVIPQILFPLLAALTLQKIADNASTSGAIFTKKWKQGLMATGAVFVLALGYYFMSDFSNENTMRTAQFNQLYNAKDPAMMQKLAEYAPQKDNQLYEGFVANFQGAPEAQVISRGIVDALKQDRASAFLGDIGRSFLIVLLTGALLFLFLKNKIREMFLLLSVTAISTIDLISFGSHYMDKNSFENKDVYDNKQFGLTQADRQILADPDPNYRVYNLTAGSPFEDAMASYHHKSIGGYHAAKLGIYDDLTSHQLSGSRPNLGVLNMLNTKYIIQPQEGGPVAVQNPEALGNAWLVKGITWVKGPVEEMQALTGFNPKDTAVVDERYKLLLQNLGTADSASEIKMTKFDNDQIEYASQTSSERLAVFSEIYYKDWNAYIDGKKSEILKVNYVLRGLVIPAGKHEIVFKFEPKVFFISKKLSNYTNWLISGLLLFTLIYTIRKGRKKPFIKNPETNP